MAIPRERNGKKLIAKFEFNIFHTTRGERKIWNMPRKFEMKKFEIKIFWKLSFLKFKMNKIEYFHF
jgi:hypothetical protein